MQTKVPAILMRGGTSKGLFFSEESLPSAGAERDKLLLTIMGSPDPSGMQLNGVGGGISSTSKVAVLSKSQRPNVAVDYLFGQVSVFEAKIDWTGSCGNLAAAAGLYAIHKNWVTTHADGSAKIKVWQANLGHELQLEFAPQKDLIAIPGVPGKSQAIYVEFINPNHHASLIPNNEPLHKINLPNGKTITASLIQGANPIIFIRASDLGLIGAELPEQINYKDLSDTLKTIGMQGADIMQIPYTAAVRVAWVASPTDYFTSDGVKINKNEISLISRITTEARIHHAYTGTGAINLACAAKIPGTIPFQMLANENMPIRIGHPKGVMQVNANVVFDDKKKKWCALSSGFVRTAKILMVGEVLVE